MSTISSSAIGYIQVSGPTSSGRSCARFSVSPLLQTSPAMSVAAHLAGHITKGIPQLLGRAFAVVVFHCIRTAW